MRVRSGVCQPVAKRRCKAWAHHQARCYFLTAPSQQPVSALCSPFFWPAELLAKFQFATRGAMLVDKDRSESYLGSQARWLPYLRLNGGGREMGRRGRIVGVTPGFTSRWEAESDWLPVRHQGGEGWNGEGVMLERYLHRSILLYTIVLSSGASGEMIYPELRDLGYLMPRQCACMISDTVVVGSIPWYAFLLAPKCFNQEMISTMLRWKMVWCDEHWVWHRYTRCDHEPTQKHSQHVITYSYTYGSVSAGREKWPFNVLFFFKVEPLCDQTWWESLVFSILSCFSYVLHAKNTLIGLVGPF